MAEQATARGLSVRHWIGAAAVALLWFYSLSDDGGHVKAWAILPLIGVTLTAAAGMFERHDGRPDAERWFTWAWVIFIAAFVFGGWLPEGVYADAAGDGDWW